MESFSTASYTTPSRLLRRHDESIYFCLVACTIVVGFWLSVLVVWPEAVEDRIVTNRNQMIRPPSHSNIFQNGCSRPSILWIMEFRSKRIARGDEFPRHSLYAMYRTEALAHDHELQNCLGASVVLSEPFTAMRSIAWSSWCLQIGTGAWRV